MMILHLYVLSLLPPLSLLLQQHVDVKKTHVWGPGLQPNRIILPARYVFVHAVDTLGKRYTTSPEKSFTVLIQGKSELGACRVWHQILNRRDGSFIVRYRMYHTCYEFSLHIKYDNQHVAKSPYFIEGPVYAEDCYCPMNTINDWLDSMHCPLSYNQIKDDLQLFNKINMNESLTLAFERYGKYPHSHSICHYVMKDNNVYRKCFGEHVGFNMFMDAILLSLARKFPLPNMEFIVNLGDWPLAKNDVLPYVPIFSWCGSEESKDIVMPTYDITESTLQTMGRTMLDMLAVMGNTDTPWEDKIEKGFWRGRDSRKERLDLVKMSQKYPHLINASLTNMFFFRDQIDEYGPLVKHVSFFKFFEYKYQITLDGTVAAYRFPYLLAGDAVIFKQDSTYYEHFYQDLEPWKHYIPIKRDLSDLLEKIDWAKNHDKEIQKMSKLARNYAENNLLGTNIFCYYAVLFKEWANRLSSPVKVPHNYELISQPQPDQGFNDCGCHRNQNYKNLAKEEL